MDPVSFTCSDCGDRAATIELIAPTPEPSVPADIGHDQWRLKIDGPVQVTHWVLRSLDELQAALRKGSIEALLDINPEYASFWCRECRAAYCRRHWEPIVPEVDDGFYDATYGTCPKGHRAMLDD